MKRQKPFSGHRYNSAFGTCTNKYLPFAFFGGCLFHSVLGFPISMMLFFILFGLFFFPHFSHPPEPAMKSRTGLPKRCPWESSPRNPGVTLGTKDVIQAPDLFGDDSWEYLHAECLHEGSLGVSFTTMYTLKKLTSLRTKGRLLCIVKGLQQSPLETLGFEKLRIVTATVTVYDPLQGAEEARAVTLLNLAECEADFFSLSESVDSIDITHVDRTPILAEIRNDHVTPDEWKLLGEASAFERHVRDVIRGVCTLSDAVFYKVHVRSNYMVQRIQIPPEAKLPLYETSGKSGIQYRAVLETSSPPEAELELLPLKSDQPLSQLFQEASKIVGHLGVFKTQYKAFMRVRNANLGAARLVLFPNDDRFTTWNRDTKGTRPFQVQGFGSGTHFSELVSFTKELGWKCVPSRVVNFRELAVFYVFAEGPPARTRVPTSRGMILITELEVKPNKTGRIQNAQHVQPSKIDAPKGNVIMKRQPEQRLESQPAAAPSFSSVVRAPPLSSRVEQLEKEMKEMRAEVSSVKDAQAATHLEVKELGNQQNRGFQQLMEAIAALGASNSSAGTPVKSPKHKASRPNP